MTGKSSSSKSKNVRSDSERPKEPKMSGAYIRDLVKQLSSSRTRDPPNIKLHENLEREGMSSNQNLYKNTRDEFSDKRPEKSNQSHQPYKKQVRRRLHTSRPYQERLLNMAEARREIVTALKFHRAAMKQASDKQQQQQQSESRPETLPVGPASFHQLSLQEEEAILKSRRNPRIYSSNSDNFSHSQGFHSPCSWPGPPPPLIQENLNLTLPSQTLGLNLNLQEFDYSDSTTSLYYSSSASTSSSSPPSSTTTTKEIPVVGPTKSVAADVVEFGDYDLHHAMDDKEMAEIRSIGEQYQMEWNDTLNLVNSAWWFEFLKTMEISPGDGKGDNFFNHPFDEAVEFPSWLNADGSCMEQVHDLYSDNYSYFEDPAALPCMDIEEMDGVDGEWLA